MAAVCLAIAVLMLNVTGPFVALPAIADGTGASFDALQWVIPAYALCLAVFQLGAGRIADMVGRRRIFLVATWAFLVASIACAIAPTAGVLLAGRSLQGAAAAALTASSLAVLAHEFDGPARSRAIGVWGGTLALSFAAGPVAGGALVDVLGWRAIFAAGVPVCLVTIWLVARFVSESRDPAAPPIDAPGMATFAGAMFLIVFAILRGNALGWTSPAILGCLVAGAALLAAFVAVERRRPAPMLDLAWFRNRTFNGSSMLVWLMAVANFGAFVYLAYFLLVARGDTAIETGLALAPAAVTTAIVSMVSGRVLHEVSLSLRFVAGQALLAVGLLALSGIEAETAWTALIPGLVLSGAGVGFTNPLSAQTQLAVMPPEHAGLASGVNNTARQLGVALGTAAMGALLDARVTDALEGSSSVAALEPAIRGDVVDRLAGPDPASGLTLAPDALADGLRGAYESAYATGLHDVLVLGALLAAVGIVVAATMIRAGDLYRPAPA
jgi:EmrB/QacA subfamily drug resistance transporter